MSSRLLSVLALVAVSSTYNTALTAAHQTINSDDYNNLQDASYPSESRGNPTWNPLIKSNLGNTQFEAEIDNIEEQYNNNAAAAAASSSPVVNAAVPFSIPDDIALTINPAQFPLFTRSYLLTHIKSHPTIPNNIKTLLLQQIAKMDNPTLQKIIAQFSNYIKNKKSQLMKKQNSNKKISKLQSKLSSSRSKSTSGLGSKNSRFLAQIDSQDNDSMDSSSDIDSDFPTEIDTFGSFGDVDVDSLGTPITGKLAIDREWGKPRPKTGIIGAIGKGVEIAQAVGYLGLVLTAIPISYAQKIAAGFSEALFPKEVTRLI
jgi:hypothetical protein